MNELITANDWRSIARDWRERMSFWNDHGNRDAFLRCRKNMKRCYLNAQWARQRELLQT